MSAHPHPPVTTPNSAQIDFTSSVNGRAYRLLVGIPTQPPPAGGYPVLLVLDGNGYFELYNGTARALSDVAKELVSPLVVGLGYPEPDVQTWLHRRWTDLTPCDNPEHHANWGPKPTCGGLEGFLDTIAIDVADALRRHWPMDARRSAVVGHSLGGMAVLHALFTRPEMFRHWIAVSPSIWYAERAVLALESAFADQVRAGAVTPVIDLSVGSLEEGLPSSLPPEIDRREHRRLTRSARMVKNTRELGARLAALPGAPGFAVRTRILRGETHGSAPFLAACGALRLAFGTQEAP